MSAASHLVLDGLDKRFGDLHVLDRVSLAVAEGEILALLGPSGSGKTTLLRLLAGFESPDAGAIRVGGDDVTGLSPAKRRFGMVFQHYALFPHLTVGENVAFGLEGDRREMARRVAETLEQVDLAGFEERRIEQLSGGQQQRVALARALAPEPRILLLDEPLSNLDPALRERTRRELETAIRRVGITTVFVTHEQEEAFDLGGRVAVLNGGNLDQVGTPEELYDAPATRFVAGFIGRNNFLDGRLEGNSLEVEAAAPDGAVSWRLSGIGDAHGPVSVAVRPERLVLTALGAPDALPGRVVHRRYAGVVTYYGVELATGGELEILAPSAAAAVDDLVGVAIADAGPPISLFAREDPAG